MHHVNDGERRSPFLEVRRPCSAPFLIRETASLMGITCQRVFSEAFKSGGYDEAISRALFARFCMLPIAKKEQDIPLIVSDFCTKALQSGMNMHGIDASEKCFGCCLTDEGLEELVLS